MATVAPPDVTKRNPAYGRGDVFEAVPGADPRAMEGFEPIPSAPHVASDAGEYTPLSPSQFRQDEANFAEGKGRLGFRRTESLGEGSRITVTQSGIAFGRKVGEGMTQSQSSRGGRSNVSLPGGYYFRRGRGAN